MCFCIGWFLWFFLKVLITIHVWADTVNSLCGIRKVFCILFWKKFSYSISCITHNYFISFHWHTFHWWKQYVRSVFTFSVHFIDSFLIELMINITWVEYIRLPWGKESNDNNKTFAALPYKNRKKHSVYMCIHASCKDSVHQLWETEDVCHRKMFEV